MREILFKAKSIRTGEWIEGYYLRDQYHIGGKDIIFYRKDSDRFTVYTNIIDIETLCQFTGLCDKNGNKIWENDILMAHLDESYPEDATYKTVEWNVAGWVGHETGSTDREYLDEFDAEHFEVVGNIFDNPELLHEVKQMERLTQRENDKLIMVKQDNGEYIPVYWDEDNFKAIEKLAAYEDLEEQGLFVKLPANKNAEIYLISSRWTICSKCGSRFDEYSCSGCEYECDSKKEYYVRPTCISSINVSFYANQFGKTVFLAREEAEKKLEEMKKND